MRILVLNCGSSSMKWCDAEIAASATPAVRVARAGRIDGIGAEARWTDRSGAAPRGGETRAVRDMREAVAWLADEWGGRPIDAVGHRVVHGGRRFTDTTILTPAVRADLRRLSDLAPLHNPPALDAIEATRTWLGDAVPMAASFDTAFHRSLPARAAAYALPRPLAAKHDIRRYGFHGIAHASMVRLYAEAQARAQDTVRAVTLQLGHGCSVTAVREGRSVDTSMGFTPLEGLVMGTRSGDVDPALVAYLARREGMDVQDVERLLNERSGLLGLSELSSHMDVLESAAAQGHAQAAFAIDVFCYRAKKYVGAYLAALGGADAVIFGGGIGERSSSVRAKICAEMEWCGVTLDDARNRAAVSVAAGDMVMIGRESSRIAVYVAGVDEEREIARDTWRALSEKR
ncbi:acetate/propionate family kinase [Nitrospira moscoviensis]|uniref:Acetate kinase n=1 Tax=Nitrospira moscoviensis TaxID=42253 RepID=A0A0K2GDC4_NITMO|nr:acetate/propionate family kinase [Nitrospira moscoviensis]ALA58950.1 Acetate kinase [Nitrospira moscoviensis]